MQRVAQAFLLSILALSIPSSACSTTPSAPTIVTGTVQYEVTGTADHIWINYINSTHGSGTALDTSLPWTYAWSTATTGDRLSLGAFIGADDGTSATRNGTLTVTIKKNGTTVATKTATGGLFTIVSVDATF